MYHKAIKLMLIGLALLFVSQLTFAQRTYFYHCSKRVNADGVIEKMDHSCYLTFSGDSMYESDRDGNITKPAYKYLETIDGNKYYYSWTTPVSGFGMTVGGYNKTSGYIVAPDYSVVNSFYKGAYINITDVYYRTTESAVNKERQSQVPSLIR